MSKIGSVIRVSAEDMARMRGTRTGSGCFVTPPPTGTVLEEAQRLVHGDRGADYGHPIDDYTRTGKLWGAILGTDPIDPRTCCLMMAAMKISRECNKHKRDNLTDLAGYAECADMIAQRQEAT